MIEIRLIPLAEFRRVRSAIPDRFERHAVVADMCRANALAAVKRAGSGHLGTSLSAMDIVTWLYDEELNVAEVGPDSPDRDVFFSSKGHDVPGHYSVLFSHGILPAEKLLALRRLGGLDGHPDVGVRGIEANSGSLGMGISKGRGFAFAGRRVFVLTGDGELQEGQNWEAFQSAAHHRTGNLTVIVDHNKVQSDKAVKEILDLGDLGAKLTAFGWRVARCDGHDMKAVAAVLSEFREVTDRPKVLIADTVKGRGVSFMEYAGGLYRWHAGAPDDESFVKAHAEVLARVNLRLTALELDPLELEPVPPLPKAPSLPTEREYVADAYGEELLAIARERDDVVVLDADLAADCRIRAVEDELPDRFVENGIAEQDMVSMAGGLARSGRLPVVNSFAAFLASRANEQIYNNASEGTRIVYALHYAGLIPAGPGKSHQSLRDISLLAALPDMTILQPGNAEETRRALRYAVEEAPGCTALRLAIGPSPRRIELPDDYEFRPGRGSVLRDGGDAVLLAYGPVMLNEALVAADLLGEQGYGLKVVNMPWLNRFDARWLDRVLSGFPMVHVLEDHMAVGGLADRLRAECGQRVEVLGVEGWPACGTPPEALRAHRLDGTSVAARILNAEARR